HIVEQHIHSLDKCMWAMKDEPPISAMGLGGRQVRVSTDFGHIFDHHAVVYEWKNGAKAFSYTRQQDGCFNEVNDYLMGTQGTCDVMKHQIKGKNPWVMKKRPQDDMYQNEHNELFASIRAGKPINDGEWMCQSTLMAIMGRMATYTGKLMNDKTFDSGTITYPLNNLIPGWQVALPLIGEGGQIKILIPSTLGYGSRGSGEIPGNAPLYFDVSLSKVK
ncbi:MAG: Inositol 2-dehydrogenase, partial [Bacteroidota bacterium]